MLRHYAAVPDLALRAAAEAVSGHRIRAHFEGAVASRPVFLQEGGVLGTHANGIDGAVGLLAPAVKRGGSRRPVESATGGGTAATRRIFVTARVDRERPFLELLEGVCIATSWGGIAS